MSRRVLVTGGAGFIGSHMAERLLADGNEVIILDNESTGMRSNVPAAAHFIAGDVRNPEDVARAFEGGLDAVFQIAGQTSTIFSFANPHNDLSINVGGTLNVLQACLEHQVPRLLYASSMICYGRPEHVPISEDHPCRPVSYYGITKYAAERYAHATAACNDLRLFNVYGPRQSLTNFYQGVVANFVANILQGQPIIIHSDGEQMRDFIFVGDVVHAWVKALDCPRAHGQVFNLGIGEGITINRLADITLASFDKSRDTHPYHPVRARAAGRPALRAGGHDQDPGNPRLDSAHAFRPGHGAHPEMGAQRGRQVDRPLEKSAIHPTLG